MEGVCDHAGQLSSPLHHQIPEEEVLSSQLLQALLVSRTGVTWWFSFLSFLIDTVYIVFASELYIVSTLIEPQ